MTRSLLIAQRELRGYIHSAHGWVITSLVLALNGVLFNALAMQQERTTTEVLRHFFYYSVGVTMVASLLLSMRTFAAERERGTLVLLTTSPTSDWELVLGKFSGAFAFLTLLVLATLYMPLLVDVHGEVHWGQVAAGYLGLMLVGACTTAIGVFASAMARHQVLAAVIGAAMIVLMLTTWKLAKVVDAPLQSVLSNMALVDAHFQPMMAGAVHLKSLCFYLCVTFFFLLASVRVLAARRWR